MPGIVAFIHKHIEPLIFFSSFSLCSNHLSWEFIKNLRPEPICWHAFLFPGMHFSLCRFAGVLLCFPACIFYFVRATIPGTLCRMTYRINVLVSNPVLLTESKSWPLSNLFDGIGSGRISVQLQFETWTATALRKRTEHLKQGFQTVPFWSWRAGLKVFANNVITGCCYQRLKVITLHHSI